jgi:redox-sensitive bicupin YhaK (pirin superfamily)
MPAGTSASTATAIRRTTASARCASSTTTASSPGAEWPLHPHQDIESNTYVVSGHFLHADSPGNNGRLEGGAAQVMTFSHDGDLHSEKNGSTDEPLRFIQFWILPSTRGLATTVQQQQFSLEDRTDRWLQIMGPAGEDGWTWPRTRARWSPT